MYTQPTFPLSRRATSTSFPTCIILIHPLVALFKFSPSLLAFINKRPGASSCLSILVSRKSSQAHWLVERNLWYLPHRLFTTPYGIIEELPDLMYRTFLYILSDAKGHYMIWKNRHIFSYVRYSFFSKRCCHDSEKLSYSRLGSRCFQNNV